MVLWLVIYVFKSVLISLESRFVWKQTVDCSSINLVNLIEQVERCTYILIGGLVEGDQVGVEAGQSHHWPQGEETHQHLQHSELELRKQWQMFWASHTVTG